VKNGTLNIVIGGEAGQGLVTVGELLSKSLVRSGYSICVTQIYQSRIRGGHNTFNIRVGTDEVGAPQEKINLLVALNRETVELHKNELVEGGLAVVDEKNGAGCDICLKVPYRQFSSPRTMNVAALGVAGCLLGLDEHVITQIVDQAFGKKHPEAAEENRRALTEAFIWTSDKSSIFEKLPRIENPNPRLMMNGNDAISLGALSAGVKFYSFYPMTPSTSIGINLAAEALRMGLVVEQAEDEIAAINMAIGASFAGAPAMVATSGGGFALMVEGTSLAGMTETPVVIVLGQRPAPATGLPTRTEQADLEFALHSGHGEFPRAIFAPGTIEECFHLTRKAFHIAETYQSPVVILTDQFIADSYRAVAPFDIGNLPSIKTGSSVNEAALPYRRHAFTENGVSMRLLPGLTQHLVVTDSDEHYEDGHITEDLSIRKRMVEKRLKKYIGMKKEVVAPSFRGDSNPDLLFVSWGSTTGSVLEAASRLDKMRVATLHFSQVWPLVPDNFLKTLESAGEVVCVEGNACGQFARLIRRETGFEIKKHIRRYDGLPITPEYILRNLLPPL